MTAPVYRHLQSRTEQGILVLTITEAQIEGEMVAEALREEMLTAAAAAGLPDKVVIDFRHTRFISSVAFRPLLALRRKLQEKSGRLVVCGLSAEVGDVFYTTRMVGSGGATTALLELEKDVAAAIARLNAAPASK